MTSNSRDITLWLNLAASGETDAVRRVTEVLYHDLRDLAEDYLRRENPGHTLQPTALIHESFLRLLGQNSQWANRYQFMAIAGTTMRRILTDHARAKLMIKRGSGRQRVPLEESQKLTIDHPEDVIAVHEALEKLEQLDPRQAKIVELRFFGGLTMPEVAQALNLSPRTIEAEWTMVRAWLRRELGGEVTANET